MGGNAIEHGIAIGACRSVTHDVIYLTNHKGGARAYSVITTVDRWLGERVFHGQWRSTAGINMFRPLVADFRVPLHGLQERDTGTQRKITIMAFGVPSLVHIINDQINDGAFGIGVCISVNHVTIFNQETQLSSKSNKNPKAVVFHASGVSVLKSMSHTDELLSIHTLLGLESATSLL
jgi:hypothetical protein